MADKLLIVIDEDDQIIEQIPCNGTNFSQQRDLEKATKKKYKDKGQKVTIRVGYINVSQELIEETKKLLEKTFEKYPEMGNMFIKERPEFTHLGYNIKNKYK